MSAPAGNWSIRRQLDRHRKPGRTPTRVVLLRPAKIRAEVVNNPARCWRQRAEDWIYAQISTRGSGMRAAHRAGGVRAAERVDRIQESRRPLRDQHARPADGREGHVDLRVRLEVPGGDLPMDGWSEP